MKTTLTQKQLLSLTHDYGIFLNPRTTKTTMMNLVNRVLSGNGKFDDKIVAFSNAVVQIERDKKLSKLGIK